MVHLATLLVAYDELGCIIIILSGTSKRNFTDFILQFELLLLLCLVEVALSADWHVGLAATDELQAVIGRSPQREGCLAEAKLANGVQLLDLFRLGDQVQDRIEAFSLVSAAKSAHYHDLTGLCHFLTEFHDLEIKGKMLERLGQIEGARVLTSR